MHPAGTPIGSKPRTTKTRPSTTIWSSIRSFICTRERADRADEAALVGEHGGLDAVAQVELREHAGDVRFDGRRLDGQRRRSARRIAPAIPAAEQVDAKTHAACLERDGQRDVA